MSEKEKRKILRLDPYLAPFRRDIEERVALYRKRKKELLGGVENLRDYASAYEYFGIHRCEGGWVYREWAPGADAMYFTGDFCDWELYSCPMKKVRGGAFECFIEGENTLCEGQKIQSIVVKEGEVLRRVPLYATRVVQDKESYLWCAEIEDTTAPYPWTDVGFMRERTPFIYETHIGMAGETGDVGSYRQFIDNVLPRIKAAGYNTIQLMAIMEHPYYASFGYQVSSFFAPSSRYGRSAELKELINTAHGMGIAVLLDVVHSHAVKNTNEGINEFDGTSCQFFHEGARSEHSAWGTKLFDYGKRGVLYFLLSNLKYWMEVFHFDGFRFDGVTSMLYLDHGLGRVFGDYGAYFSDNTDLDAVVYLQLACELIHSIKENALIIAEDMSGMPGMCLPVSAGGIGFDYRLSMGVPDLWIKLIKEKRDEEWDMWQLWYELTTRRAGEKNIGYAESHDQALVGDKTIMFRLCDAEMYTRMSKDTQSIVVDRGIALHKMIRLLTSSLAGEGYLNFMGNEFGHPEWIDFPRAENGWSYHYARRQWSLCDNGELRYGELYCFDKAMIALLKNERTLEKKTLGRWISNEEKIIIYERGGLLFAFNFSPTQSYEKYFIPTGRAGGYSVVLSTDDAEYGGFERVDTSLSYKSFKDLNKGYGFFCYLPSRTAIVFKRI